MKQLMKTIMVAALALTVASPPALADKYAYYGGYGNHHYKKHGYKYHPGKGHAYGHYKHHKYYKHYPKYYYKKPVVVYRPTVHRSYYHSSAYYNEPAYRSVRCTNQYNPLGTLLGGAAGGLLGHQIGKGAGKVAATIGGAVLGGAIGHGVSQHCTEQVIYGAPIGTPVAWQSPRSNENYYVTATREYQQQGRYCREYQAVATVAGRQQQTYGTACMQPDGDWEVIN